MPLRVTIIVVAVLAGIAAWVSTAAGEPAGDALTLVRSYLVPAADPASARLADRGWIYDSAVTAAADAAGGQVADARVLLDQMAELQRPTGALGFSYDVRTGTGDALERTGAVAWVGLAAVQYRTTTCSDRYDALMDGVAGWLLERRVTDPAAPGRGLMTGGADVSWISTEHNLEARAFLNGLAALIDGRVGDCRGGLAGRPAAGARARAAELRDAVAALDAGIERELFVREAPGRAHFGQGVEDGARPIDAQALGILWLVGQGRASDAAAVSAAADDAMLVRGRTFEGRPDAGTFTGYTPYAEGWGPDVLWMEGALQMRMARAATGADTGAIDDSADRWAALGSGGLLPQADRTLTGNPAGDYHTWSAAAPAAWLRLSRAPTSLLS
jgi:hypothetical protein